jgi:hypothetical protein
MMAFVLILIPLFAWSQEIELTTRDVRAYARVKNCIDFYTCLTYEETLKIHQGSYRWSAKFKDPITSILKAFDECRVGDVEFDLFVKDQDGSVINDFSLPRYRLTTEGIRHLLPMELYQRTFEGLKRKENSIDVLLRHGQPELALKSTVFEMEYGLGEYQLEVKPIPRPNVLATTHHLKKMITYDLDKWDGSLCRFYQVVRHEVQHVRNNRKQRECVKHHFHSGNNNERVTYLNDLVFIKTYCPQEVDLYKNVEAMLLKMYENKNFQTCEGEGQGTLEGSGSKAGPSQVVGVATIMQKLKTIRQSLPRHFNSHRYSLPQRKVAPPAANPSGLH